MVKFGGEIGTLYQTRFKKHPLQNRTNVQIKGEGGGVKGLLNNVQKKCTFLNGWLPQDLFVELFFGKQTRQFSTRIDGSKPPQKAPDTFLSLIFKFYFVPSSNSKVYEKMPSHGCPLGILINCIIFLFNLSSKRSDGKAPGLLLPSGNSIECI